MHPNTFFRQSPRARNISFARETGFGMLSMNGDTAPLVSHVPFLLDETGQEALFHLVRSNPIARALAAGPAAACLAVQGPHSYVSPDWYGIDDQVPTWNYLAVHLRGRINLADEAGMRDLLERQSASYEARLSPKRPWTSDKMSQGVMDRMMRQIVPCRMRIQDIDGTWKFSQNKSEAARLLAADHVAGHGMGAEVSRLANLMRAEPPSLDATQRKPE